jgi:hypothetical protein
MSVTHLAVPGRGSARGGEMGNPSTDARAAVPFHSLPGTQALSEAAALAVAAPPAGTSAASADRAAIMSNLRPTYVTT